MEFSRKSLSETKTLVLSERPLYAMQLEERIASLIPAMETSVDSFEEYLAAYEHCAKLRTVGAFFLHYPEQSKLPSNAIDELAGPFEAVDATAGLFVIAESEKAFAKAYQVFGQSPRLLGITLEADLAADATFKAKVLEIMDRFEKLQQKQAVPREELEFFMKTARRFEDIDLANRIAGILTAKLDKGWFDELLVESGPTLLAIPESQKWILNNSPSLTKVAAQFAALQTSETADLVAGKDPQTMVTRAVLIAYRAYQASKAGTLETFLTQHTQGANAFAPTLKRVLNAEKQNLLSLRATARESGVA